MGVYEKLIKVQSDLKAPKSKFNSFGKYNYRSLEDILEGVKPLLVQYKATLIMTDGMEQVGDRYYLKATATFIDTENGESVSNSALARESADKRGMDDSQITGTASSYARKYALNGLLLIDDTKDMDTDEAQAEGKARAEKAEKQEARTQKAKSEPKKSDAQLNREMIESVPDDLIPDANRTPEYRAKRIREEIARTKQDEKRLLNNARVEKWEDVSDAQFVTLMGFLAKR